MNKELISEPQQTLLQSIKKNMGWKMGLCLAITAFIIYPRPFLYFLKPVCRRVSRSYSRYNPKINKIFLTTEKRMNADKLIKLKMYDGSVNDVEVINLLTDGNRSSQSIAISSLNKTLSNTENSCMESPLELKADNTTLKIKLLIMEACQTRDRDYAILIKGNAELLRLIEARIYGFEFEEYYKIPMFSSRSDIHVLQTDTDFKSFEHKVIKVNL